MDNLTTLIASLRQDLHDEDASNYRWTDAHLERHIRRALQDYSRAAPCELYSDIATVSDSRDISLSSLDELVKVFAVEWPIGNWPPAYLRFSLWGDTLTMDSISAGDTTDARIFYGRLHQVWQEWEASTAYALGDMVVPSTHNGYAYECTVAGTSDSSEPSWPTTVGNTVSDNSVTWTCRAYYPAPERHADLLLLGASGFALVEWANYAINRTNVGGVNADTDYTKEGERRLADFRKELRSIGHTARVRQRRLYSPATPPVSKSRVEGP